MQAGPHPDGRDGVIVRFCSRLVRAKRGMTYDAVAMVAVNRRISCLEGAGNRCDFLETLV